MRPARKARPPRISAHIRERQRSGPGCSGGRMPRYFGDSTPGVTTMKRLTLASRVWVISIVALARRYTAQSLVGPSGVLPADP